jgi:hypothetical protein
MRSESLGSIVILSAGALVLIAVAAVAQPNPDPRTTASTKIGAVYLNPTLAVVDLGWDNNVFNGTIARRDDFTFTFVPRVDAWAVFARRGAVNAQVAVPLVYYHTFASERSANVDLAVRGELYLRRLTLFADAFYVNTRQRPNFEIDQRVRRVEDGIAGGVILQPTTKLSMEVSLERATMMFEDDDFIEGVSVADGLNHTENAVSVTAGYQVTPFTRLVVESEVAEDRFPSAPIRDGTSVRLLPGVQLNPRALISGSAQIGYGELRPRTRIVPAFEGLIAAADLSYRLRGATLVGAAFERDVAFSFEPLEPYFVVHSVGGTVRRQLAGPFEVIVRADRHVYAYRMIGSDPSRVRASADRSDVTRVYSVDVGYRLAGTSRLVVGVSHWERLSDRRSSRNYNGIRFGTTVTHGF